MPSLARRRPPPCSCTLRQTPLASGVEPPGHRTSPRCRRCCSTPAAGAAGTHGLRVAWTARAQTSRAAQQRRELASRRHRAHLCRRRLLRREAEPRQLPERCRGGGRRLLMIAGLRPSQRLIHAGLRRQERAGLHLQDTAPGAGSAVGARRSADGGKRRWATARQRRACPAPERSTCLGVVAWPPPGVQQPLHGSPA